MTEATFRIRIQIDPDDTDTASKGANSVDVDTSLIAGEVIKSVPEQRFTLCVGYPARKPDTGVAADGFRDWSSEESVEKAAWNYLRKSPKVGLHHHPGNDTEGAAEVVESYIYRRDDPWIIKAADGTEQRICKGDWLIGLVWSEAGWNSILSGEITGVSAQGRAKRRPSDPADLATLRS
jgi:hypothetical protein